MPPLNPTWLRAIALAVFPRRHHVGLRGRDGKAARRMAMLVAMLRYKLEAGEPFTVEDARRELSVLMRRMLGNV